MKTTTYSTAAGFMRATQQALETNEAANSLMLGICQGLVQHPERIKTVLSLTTVEDENGLVIAAMMTPPHNLVVYGHQGGIAEGARVLVDSLIVGGWTAPGVLGPQKIARTVAERWVLRTGARYVTERRQRVFELRQASSPPPAHGSLRAATPADLDLVTQWWVGFDEAIFGQADRAQADAKVRRRIREGDIFLWVDHMPVSMSMKTRPTRNGISISAVYTPPELRGQGYATACVGELSRHLLESGWRYCALFADRANTAANHVYLRIGYEPVCDYDEYAFVED